jgi:hypothetical protein
MKYGKSFLQPDTIHASAGCNRALSNNNSHIAPERGCVVPTSRSTPAQPQAVVRIYALRLVLRR